MQNDLKDTLCDMNLEERHEGVGEVAGRVCEQSTPPKIREIILYSY